MEEAFKEWMASDTRAGRKLFMTHHPGGHGNFILGIGLGRADFGDQIWMSKGRKMLYILRPKVVGVESREVAFDMTSQCLRDAVFLAEAPRLKPIEEAFVLGLMEGELVKMLAQQPQRSRPPQLAEMGRDWNPVYIM
jgi:hypothetical protein